MPPALKRLVLVVAWTAATLAALYLAAATWIWNLSPGPIVPFSQRLRERMKVDGSEVGAWPAYREAMMWQRHRADMPEAIQQLQDAFNVGVDDPKWTVVRDQVTARPEEMKMLRAAALQPTLGYMPGTKYRVEDALFLGYTSVPEEPEDGPAIQILLPHIGTLRRAAMLLRAETFAAAESGDGARVVQTIAAILGTARHAAEVDFAVSQIVGLVIRRLAYDSVPMLLERYPQAFTDEQLAVLADLLGQRDGNLVVRLDAERDSAYDMAQRLFTQDADGNGTLIIRAVNDMRQWSGMMPGQEVPPAPILFLQAPIIYFGAPDRAEVLKAFTDALDEFAEQAQLPAWKQNLQVARRFRAQASRTGSIEAVTYFPFFLGPRDFAAMALSTAGARSAREHARVQVALERYRRAYGAWPGSMEDLVPKFLPTVPRDEFEDAPLKLELVDGKPVIRGKPEDPKKTAAESEAQAPLRPGEAEGEP